MDLRKAGFRFGMVIALMAVLLNACTAKTPVASLAPGEANPAYLALKKMLTEFHYRAWKEFPHRYATPAEAVGGIARDYDWNKIPSSDFLGNFYSPLVTFTHLERQCDETALLVAYAVADDGYPPLILFLYSEDQNYIGANHALFVFEENGLWGYTDWTHYASPRYRNIEELFYNYQKFEPAYVSYALFDFNRYRGDWKGTFSPLVPADEITIAKGPTSIWLYRVPLKDETNATTRAARIVAVNSGSVSDQEVISTAMLAGVAHSCCGLPATETEALMTFDLSPIPRDAQVVSVLVDFRQFMFYGDPFYAFSCLEVFTESFSDIRMVEFEREPDGLLTRWCTQRDLSMALYTEAFRALVQESLEKGYVQLRLKFKMPKNDADVAGNQMIFNRNIMLVVTYTLPE